MDIGLSPAVDLNFLAFVAFSQTLKACGTEFFVV